MPLRALRLSSFLNAAKLKPTTSPSFYNLQNDANREWSRRAIAHSQTRILAQWAHRSALENKTMDSSGEQDHALIPLIPEHTNCEDADITDMVPDDAYFDPALNDHEHVYFDPVLNNYEPTHRDLFSIEPWDKDRLKRLFSDDLELCLTTVNIRTFAFRRGPTVLPSPTNDRTLYYNLIHILRTRTSSRPTLAALLDYHLLFPNYHSVKSYNLLISLSIHHRAYGITHNLFRAMQYRSIQYDIGTHQLYIRWTIFRGFWDRAWNYAMQLKDKFPGGNIPFPIWLEFCHARRKGPIIESTFNPKTKRLVRDLSEPVRLISARSNVMNANRPPSIPALKDTRPADIRNIVQLMVKSNMKHQALKLTEDYFRALSLRMDSGMNDRCLDIVKIHLAFNGIGKAPLPRFTRAKTLLISLLSLNPSLRPTSDTIKLMLSPLKRVRRSGTVAWKFISLCREKWGFEDRQIRRLVTRLALKEGRMDIVEILSREQADESRARFSQTVELEVVGEPVPPVDMLKERPLVRTIYPHNGRETYMWRRLDSRVRRIMKKRRAQGRQFIMCARSNRSLHRQFNRTSLDQIRQFTKREARHLQSTKLKARDRRFTERKDQDQKFGKRKSQGRQIMKRARSPAMTRKPTKSIP